MNPSPSGWPRLSSTLAYPDAQAAIAWLGGAFGFAPRLVVEGEGGLVEHSELVYGEAVVMVADERRATPGVPALRSPNALGGGSQSLFLYVDDVEAHHARAVAAGAVVTRPLTVSDYGEEYWSDRSYGCVDPAGHHWWFAQRLRSPAP